VNWPRTGAYGEGATCRHGVHPYECVWCDPQPGSILHARGEAADAMRAWARASVRARLGAFIYEAMTGY
jgi:hypothetical protein